MSDTALLPLVFFGARDAYERLRKRLTGLTDDEYRWEPVAGMWSVRAVDGRWQVDESSDPPTPPPVTTIAWRTWHIASSCLAEYVAQLGPWPLQVQGREWYPDAASAIAELDRAWLAFHGRVHELGEAGVRGELGPDWGPFEHNTWADLVAHAGDEIAHHGAEIALLRDLYPQLSDV